MADIRQGRWTAEIDGDFVVFLIGARINSKLQALRAFRDLGGSKGMRAMLEYLTAHPEKGLLGFETAGFTVHPVLAIVRAPRGVRQGQGRSTPRGVAQLLEACRQVRPKRHLARDVLGPRRRVRGDLRQHATARTRQGVEACAAGGRCRRPPTAQVHRGLTDGHPRLRTRCHSPFAWRPTATRRGTRSPSRPCP